MTCGRNGTAILSPFSETTTPARKHIHNVSLPNSTATFQTECPNCGRFLNSHRRNASLRDVVPGSEPRRKRPERPKGTKDSRPRRSRGPPPNKGKAFAPPRPPTISEARWDTAGARRRIQLHHWHAIQNTTEGEDAERDCERCRSRNLTCRFYKYVHHIKICLECNVDHTYCVNGAFTQEERPVGEDIDIKIEA